MVSESVVRKIRLAFTVLLALVAALGLTSESHWLVLISLSFLATSALLPNVNPVLYWPVGLLGIIVSSFGGYCFLWLTNSGGVDSSFSRSMFAILGVGFLCIAITRLWRKNYSAIKLMTLKPIVTTIMVFVPVILVVIVTHRFFDNPTNLISGFIAGGDHNAHNEITYNLLAWSGNVTIESPLNMYSYPKGLHFLIANLIAITGNPESIPRLVQELRMGAWFEWVQLAAFFQLAILCVMKGARGAGIKRAILLAPIFFVFASMDNFVNHLFWSGFTTSLGITWLFLIPFALPMVFETQRKASEVFPMQFVWFLFLGIGAWLMYQPYAVVFAAVGVTTLCIRPMTSVLKQHLSRFGVSEYVVPSTLVIFLVSAIVLSLYLFLGRDSSAVKSLLLDGATTRPFFYTVCMWALLAVVFLRSETSTDRDNTFTSSSVFLGLIAFTFAMMLIVLRTSDFGLTNQPYYIQKMLWVILFVSIPIVVGAVLRYFEQFLLARNDSHLSYYATAVCVLLLTPLVMGRYPTAAFKHGSVDWFAKGISSSQTERYPSKVAFSRGDQIGTHVANLALHTSSKVKMPLDIGLSNNPYWACRFVNTNQIPLVITAGNGVAELVASGCNSSVQFVTDGVFESTIIKNYLPLPLNFEADLRTSSAALMFFQKGVLPHTEKENWATGYHSTIVFSIPEKVTEAVLELSLVRAASGPVNRSITLGVNGKTSGSYLIPNKDELMIPVSLGSNAQNANIEVTIDCAWSDAEISKLDPYEYPPACLGLKSMKLISKGS